MLDIPASSDLEAQVHRKMLFLIGPVFVVLGIFYFWYSVRSGLQRWPWASTTMGVAGAVGLAWALFTGQFLRGIQIVSLGVFAAFAYSSAHQQGVYSSSLWWLVLPPVFLMLAGSLRLGGLTGVLFLIEVGVLAAHGPASMGSTSLVLGSGHVQMVIAETVSTIVLLIVTGMSVFWRLELQRALEAARQAANQAAEAKARFLANMSHEIRTPLNGVIGAIDLLRSARTDDAQRAQLMALQEQSAKSLLAVVNDVLDWSKLEAGKVRLEAAPLYLRGLVFESNELFAGTAFAKGIELTSSCNPDVPRWFVGDATRIRQIVNNLVGNAVKFTSQGGVHVHLALQGEDPRDAPDPHGRRWVRVEVADSGIGLSADQVSRLFRAFEQADASTARRYGGTGLGLAISSELAAMMGGRIEVSSTAGKGSTFTLLLPLAVHEEAPPTAVPRLRSDVLLACSNQGLLRHVRALLHELGVEPAVAQGLPSAIELQGRRWLVIDAQLLGADSRHWLEQRVAEGLEVAVLAPLTDTVIASAPQGWRVLHKPVRRAALAALVSPEEAERSAAGARSSAPSLTQARVLLCEDNPVNQVVVQAMLAEIGASCRVAGNGQEALRCLEEERFDVVLMDVQMPELDGLQATRRWREQEAQGGKVHVPIVAMTADAEGEAGAACREAGMDGYLAKPFGLQALRHCISEWTRGRDAASAKR